MFLISLFTLSPRFYSNLNYDKKRENISQYNLKSSGHWVLIDTTFVIDDTSPYWLGSMDWATYNATYDWCNGEGTLSNPYVIENLTMIGYDDQASIWIMDSNVHFIIRNCTFIDEGIGLDITNSENGKIINNTFVKKEIGLICGGNDFTIFENRFHDNDRGLVINGGDNYNISKNLFIDNKNGLQMVNDVEYSLIYANTFKDNDYGIYLHHMNGENNNFSYNLMYGCGFYHYDYDDDPVWAETNIIETSNLVNGKPLYLYFNESSLRSINFTNAGQVILIKCNNSNIANLDISKSTFGIGLYYCKNNALTNNNCSFHSYAGIYLRNCNNITLDSNLATFNHISGISLALGNNYNLTNNQMINCGLNVYGTLEDFYSNSIDSTNLVNNKPVYYLTNQSGLDPSDYPNAGQLFLIECNNSLIADLEIYNTSQGITSYYCYNNIYTNIDSSFNYRGMYFSSCSNNIISGVNTTDNEGVGVCLIDCNNNKVIGNTIRECRNQFDYILQVYTNPALSIMGDNNTIIGNTITDNPDEGIYISGEYNNITDNNIYNNGDGISFEVVTNNLIIGNNITSNIYNGIHFLEDCDNNQILGNLINGNNGTGIFAEWNFANNEIIRNIISNNALGINFGSWCYNNSLYRNLFLKNGMHVIDDGTDNNWNCTTIGNYWDNHTAPDANNDGIVDNPYTYIGGLAGSIDYLPIAEDGAPRITIISPSEGDEFSEIAPEFNITVIDLYLDTMWYTIEGNMTQYFIKDLNGTIDQDAWDNVLEEEITITFYAQDIVGNVGSKSVSIIKIAPSTGRGIPGFNIFLIISTISVISLFIVKKKFK